jgi:hypothetical protein
MRAILIDPFERTVTEVEWSGNFRDAQKGAYKLMQCDLIDVVYFDSPWINVNMFVDDEGLFKQELAFFLPLHSRAGQPIVGRALLVGPPDNQGDSTACPISLPEAKAGIQFADALE